MISTEHNFDYDLIVIGAGPGGSEAAREVAKAGKKVALIEWRDIGGTCLNRGCIPAKTMLYMAEIYRDLHKIDQYGIKIDLNSVQFDFAAMIKKRGEIMDKLRKGLAFQFNKDQVEVINDFAELVGNNEVFLKNSNKKISADQIILATGGRARRFPGFKEEDKRYLTSDNIFELSSLPKSITIVGAGPVGTEFANFFHALGTEVHIIDRVEPFLSYYDHNLGSELIKAFTRQGINCHLNTQVSEINDSNDLLEIKLANDTLINSQYILSAIGVEVLTDFIKTGLKIENGKVAVNAELETSQSNIHALGDLIGKSGSAYGAEREAKYIAYKLLGKDTSLVPVDYTSMPDVVFTYPEVATCGLSKEELTNQGIEFESKEVQFMVNAKAQIKNETRGKIWLYSEKNSGQILGVHIIGAQATEIIHQIPLVLLNKMTIKDYLKVVWGHPVMCEIIKDVILMG